MDTDSCTDKWAQTDTVDKGSPGSSAERDKVANRTSSLSSGAVLGAEVSPGPPLTQLLSPILLAPPHQTSHPQLLPQESCLATCSSLIGAPWELPGMGQPQEGAYKDPSCTEPHSRAHLCPKGLHFCPHLTAERGVPQT